jgi:branched-subunit amino acid transport protein
MAAIHGRSDRRREVLASIVAGALAVLVVQLTVGNRAGSLWTPATVGLIAAVVTYAAARVTYRQRKSASRLE